MPQTLYFDLRIIEKIKKIINVFETGTVTGDYGKISIFNDGKHSSRQITYGRSQTTEQGNLNKLVVMYIANNGKYAKDFKPYVPKIGVNPLVDSIEFLHLLRLAGADEVMQKTQDQFFDQVYFNPAVGFYNAAKFTLALSLLVVYDSYIHSGGVPEFIRDDFDEVPPNKGGDEKEWVRAYVNARDKWLENHPKKLLQNTDYRTDSFIHAIRQDNWNLDRPFYVVNYPDREELQKPQVRNVII